MDQRICCGGGGGVVTDADCAWLDLVDAASKSAAAGAVTAILPARFRNSRRLSSVVAMGVSSGIFCSLSNMAVKTVGPPDECPSVFSRLSSAIYMPWRNLIEKMMFLSGSHCLCKII